MRSAANETREVRVSAAKETRDTSSVEERAQTYCRAKLRCVAHRSMTASSPSPTNRLQGRMAPKEKEELRLPAPETAIEFLMAACAHAAEMDFQSVGMADVHLSIALHHHFRFSLPFLRCILYHAATHKQMNKGGTRTLAAVLAEIRVGCVIHRCNTRVDLVSVPTDWCAHGRGGIGSSEDRPSCELGEERRLAGWDDGDLEGL